MLIPLVALIAVAATTAYIRFMGFETVSYELRQCEQPLTAESSWDEVQAAGCDPADAAGTRVELYHEGVYVEPDSVSEATYTFEGWPVNSPSHAIGVWTTDSARSIVVAEPTNEAVRDQLSSDSAGTTWSGFVGARGPTTYWVLLTP